MKFTSNAMIPGGIITRVKGFLLAIRGLFSHLWLKTPRGILSAE